MTIHKTAIIDPSSKIGNDVTIEAYVVIGPKVTIGDGCRIRSHAYLEYTELGENCEIFPQASLGTSPQHTQYNGQQTKLVVGPRCIFREGTTAHRGTQLDQGLTTVGSDGYFMALSHIAHDCRIGNKVIIANAAQLAGHVKVGDSAFISSTVGIHQFVRIGAGALISGGAMVPTDVAPYCNAQGDRASIKGLNLVGMKRAGLSRQSIKNIKNCYKILFLSGLRLDEALRHRHFQVDDPHVKIMKDFISVKNRGLLRPELTPVKEKESVA